MPHENQTVATGGNCAHNGRFHGGPPVDETVRLMATRPSASRSPRGTPGTRPKPELRAGWTSITRDLRPPVTPVQR